MAVMMVVAAAALMVVMVFVFLMMMAFPAAALMIMMVLVFFVGMAVFFFVMVMAMLMDMSAFRAYFFLQHFLLQRYRMLHNLKDLLSIQVRDRSCDDRRLAVDAPEQFHSCGSFGFVHNIRAAHDDGSCIFHLIVKELSKVSHIHFTFFRVHNGGIAVQHKPCFLLHSLDSLDHIGKLAYAGGLDKYTVGMVFGDHFF